ncbi:MAG: aminopeptidase N [Bdellovibrionota bacterium]
MQQKRIFLKDYQAPTHQIRHTELTFELGAETTVVTAVSKFSKIIDAPLFLNGKELELVSIKLDGKDLIPPDYDRSDEGITIHQTPTEFTLEIITKIYPSKNTALEGLYVSKGILSTQCEAQGFRRITYFLDRPDVLTKFRTTLRGSKKDFPVLLCNGNRISGKDLSDGRHEVIWEDPSLKPCYLFALVGGDLGVLRDNFTTSSGRQVNLEIYSVPGTQKQCQHAMDSLKKSMSWDENVFGREYDLNDYMIVAIDDFNAGAMENKGLNVFNSRLVFADDQVATDEDFFAIESVIAHEYFHNWTGNRITLRDWFHLSLKEGLTVFRDQEFSGDMSDRSVQRLKDVETLKLRQFAEDAGPNAHPVRPESCLSVDNFFTATIYEKGAEVIRMLSVLLGRKSFLKGMDLYFSRHDGQAVTIEDFVKCFEDTSKRDLAQFREWYRQKGTPVLEVSESYDPSDKTYSLKFVQDQTPAVLIPVQMGFLNADGSALYINHPDIRPNSDGELIFEMDQKEKVLIFNNVSQKPVPSLLRQFSAPVHLKFSRDANDHLLIAAFDSDGFNRRAAFTDLVRQSVLGAPFDNVEKAFGSLLNDKKISALLKATILKPTHFDEIIQTESTVNVKELSNRYRDLFQKLASTYRSQLIEIYTRSLGLNQKGYSTELLGERLLKNRALDYLSFDKNIPEEIISQAQTQLASAKGLSDVMSALHFLLRQGKGTRELQNNLLKNYSGFPLVLQKIYAAFSSQQNDDAFVCTREIMERPEFDSKNPNNIYATLRTFGLNTSIFHQGKPDIYGFYMDWVHRIDGYNPQVSARLMGAFNLVGKLPAENKLLIKDSLHKLLVKEPSANLRELAESVYQTL